MLFLRCSLPGILFFGGSGRSRALLAVLWLGGLFYGGMSFMPLFTRFVRGFVGLLRLSIILSLSGGCRLCVCCVRRVSALWPVVFDGGLFFFRQFFFIVDVRFYIFSVVECCFLAICLFNISVL